LLSASTGAINERKSKESAADRVGKRVVNQKDAAGAAGDVINKAINNVKLIGA
jgi:hypothetical protein